MKTRFSLTALAGLLSACAPAPQPPLATTVCDLATHAQRTVQIDAAVGVDSAGKTMISDTGCPATQIELRLSAAGTRGGGAEQLKSAAQQAVGSGKSSFPVKLTGVYTQDPSGAYFAADSVTVVPPG